MKDSPAQFTIGALATAAEVTVETVRFYQRKGLLPEPEKPYGSIRRYSNADVARVRFIKFSQRLGFTLGEVAQLLELEDCGTCREVAELAEQKLADVRSRLRDLARMETVLAGLVDECHRTGENVPCPLISSLLQESSP